MRSDLLAVFSCQVFHYLTETCIVHIHLCHIDHPGKIILITKLPGFFRTNLHASLAGNNDDRRVCRADRFFYLSHKVKISRRIKDIYLRFFPLDRDQACADRKSAFLLLFIKITDCVGLCDLAHTVRGARYIEHCLDKTCLSAPAVPEQYHVPDFVRSVNLHAAASLICSYYACTKIFHACTSWIYCTKIFLKLQLFYVFFTYDLYFDSKKVFFSLSSVSIVFLSFTFIMQRAKMSLCCAVP